MASSASDYLENILLNATFNATAFTGAATIYAKLHLGAPGEAGTANAAVETTRTAVGFGAAASGTVTNDSAATWTNVSTTETYTAISLWDHLTAGNCLVVMDLAVSRAVTAGDTFTIAIGDLTVTAS